MFPRDECPHTHALPPLQSHGGVGPPAGGLKIAWRGTSFLYYVEALPANSAEELQQELRPRAGDR